MVRDVLILGEDIAASCAAVYAARKKLDALLVADSFMRQQPFIPETFFFPGIPEKNGMKIIDSLRTQTQDLDIHRISIDGIEKISFRQEENREIFVIEDKQGAMYEGKSVILASGKKPRKLGIPGEDQFLGKGVEYYVSAPAEYAAKKIAIVGSGAYAIHTALQLARHAEQVVIFEQTSADTGDQDLAEKARGNKKITFIADATMQEILGSDTATGVKYSDKTKPEPTEFRADAVFIMVGMIPHTDFLKGLCDLNQWGEIIINPKTNATSHVGIFAAGDATDAVTEEPVIAAAEGARAALQCYRWLTNK